MLDLVGRTMTLPRMMGCKDDVVVRYRDVRAIEVDRVFPPKSGTGRHYEYYPTLVLARLDGRPSASGLASGRTVQAPSDSPPGCGSVSHEEGGKGDAWDTAS